MRDELFNVYLHFPDGSYHQEKAGVGAEEAILTARDFTLRPAGRAGLIAKIQVVAIEDDATVFLWEHGRGVVFPTREELAANRKEGEGP